MSMKSSLLGCSCICLALAAGRAGAADDYKSPPPTNAKAPAPDAKPGAGYEAAPGQGNAQVGGEFQRPAYVFLRQNEDWSGLSGRDTATTGDFLDPVKFVPFNDDGSIYATFGGHVRFRFEQWSNFNFSLPGGAAEDDDEFLLGRVMLHSDVHFGKNVRVFAELKSAFSEDRQLPATHRTIDDDTIDLQQLFADVLLPLGQDASVTLRGGRQMLAFGKQRLVSPLPWGNTLRSWDGVTAIVKAGGWKVDAFWTQVSPVQKYEFNDADAQTQFWGAYATGKLPVIGIMSDVYFLALDKEDAVTFNGTTGGEERYTVGARLWGKIGESAFDYDVESAYQFGSVGAGDINAYMFASQVGYTFASTWASPRVHVGFDYASGDDAPGGDVETFNQLFPLGHAYQGIADVVGRQNAIDLSVGLTTKPMSNLTIWLETHFLYRASAEDGLYDKNSNRRPGGLGTSKYIGTEIDIWGAWQVQRHILVESGYAHVFAEDFIEESTPGAASDIDYFYLMLTFTF